ncbi:MAG: hypothetical protein U0746_12725 [Gemmataceae bacterium]
MDPGTGAFGDGGSSPSTGAFGSAPGAGTGSQGSATPNLAGNFSGVPYIRSVTTNKVYNTQFAIFNVNGIPVGTSNPVAVGAQYITYRQEIDVTRGAFFITENENPRPQTRAYFRYQYFTGVPVGPTDVIGGQSTYLNTDDAAILAAATTELNRLNAIQAANGLPPINATPEQAALLLKQDLLRQTGTTPAALAAQVGAAAQAAKLNVHREVFGYEQAFCSDLFSVGVRVPLIQTAGDTGFGIDDFGHVSLILKSLLYTNLATGTLLSGGVVFSFPTAPTLETIDGNVDSTFFQPYFGYILHCPSCPRLFVQGFTGAVIPSDNRDVTFCYNDIAFNYTVYQACDCRSMFQSLTPALEFHVINPLNHRGMTAQPIGLPDMLNLTYALHANIGNRMQMSGAIVTPVTGPKLFDCEFQLSVDFRF